MNGSLLYNVIGKGIGCVLSSSGNIAHFLHNAHFTRATAHYHSCFSVCSILCFILSRQRCTSYACSAIKKISLRTFHSEVVFDPRRFLRLTTLYITTPTCGPKVTPNHALLGPLHIASIQHTVSVASTSSALWSLVAQTCHSARLIVNRFRSKKPSMCILQHKSMGLNVTFNHMMHTCAFPNMWHALFGRLSEERVQPLIVSIA